jgi:hypothetical protein
MVKLEPQNKWIHRGYANHLWLYVDTEGKQFETCVSSYQYIPQDVIRVQAKEDITEYIEYLKRIGFQEVDELDC